MHHNDGPDRRTHEQKEKTFLLAGRERESEEVVPLRVEVEVAVPDLTPAEW
jgi:hypothetical protein